MIYTSYFYQVRFMPRNLIPLSTALSDPKWYHDWQGARHIFLDKRGVINGLRATPFAPGVECEGLCNGPAECKDVGAKRCAFLTAYEAQLDKLNIVDILTRMGKSGDFAKELLGINEKVDFALLVHEAPSNICSERAAIQKWFYKYGIEVNEWTK